MRASTDPGDLPAFHDMPDLREPSASRKWLSILWEHPQARNAVSASSPVLYAQVEAMTRGQYTDERRLRKAVLSMAAYLARWQRPTPFGLFAGVAPITFGPDPAVLWGGDHRVCLRADTEWLADVIARLHQCPALVERLHVVANNTAQIRGQRVVVAGQSADGHERLASPVEVSVRRTPPVAMALEAARTSVPYSGVRGALVRRFPDTPRERIDALLGELLSQNLLLSNLWAPMTCTDALGHLCIQLTEAGADRISQITDLVGQLHSIHHDLARPTAHTAWPLQEPTLQRMRTLTGVAPLPVIVDTALDCRVELPTGVVRTIEKTADVLARVSAHPFGRPEWRDYHHRFRARYGPGAVVPVLELVSDSGLGWPAEYLGAGRRRPHTLFTERDAVLLELVQQTTARQGEEIVLTEELITRLGPAQGEQIAPPPRVELCVQLHAPTVQALAREEFTAVVTGAPRPGSSLLGRFAHLLSDQARDALATTYRSPATDDVVVAQLSFPARKRRNDNIVRTRRLASHVVPLAEHHPDGQDVIEVADLGVGADATGMHLRRLSTGQRIELRVAHALEAGTHTPPLARFLAEVATARCAAYGAFDFGAAARLPYLPRVRYGNTVVAPARWLLSDDDLPDSRDSQTLWEANLEQWRARWRVPARVALVEHDRRLPLDLSQPLHRHLLHQRLGRAGRVELSEAWGPEQAGWLGRAHELVVSLRTPESCLGPVFGAEPAHQVQAQEMQLPGSRVLHTRLYVHPERVDEILTDHLPVLGIVASGSARWWFSRHRDLTRPDAPTFLELSVCPSESHRYGDALEDLHTWAEQLRREHLLAHMELAAYHPQHGRYGHGAAMEAAEEVWRADSDTALAQIRASRSTGIEAQALTAAGMVDLVTCFTSTPAEGLAWLVHDLAHTPGPVDREVRRQALALSAPGQGYATLHRLVGGTHVAQAWQARARALADYRKHLAAEREPTTVLRSLLHLHQVRTLGADPEQEAATIRAARAVALAHTARRPK
nr:lantibiotic dehydratase [Nocardiopsis algeriensis]